MPVKWVCKNCGHVLLECIKNENQLGLRGRHVFPSYETMFYNLRGRCSNCNRKLSPKIEVENIEIFPAKDWGESFE